MGWRPLTERLGKQICEYHWLRHKDPQDSFDLFDAFGFRKIVRASDELGVSKQRLSEFRKLAEIRMGEMLLARNGQSRCLV